MIAKISKILSSQGVDLVEFKVGNDLNLSMLSLEGLNFNVNDEVCLGFKSSDVIISTSKLENCSIRNEIPSIINSIDFGEILTLITLEYENFKFESIISTASAKALNLEKNTKIYAYIKSTSLFIRDNL